MIRVKAFSIRQMTNTLAFGFVIMVLAVFVIFTIFSTIYLIEKELKENLLNSFEIDETNILTKKEFINHILESEISLLAFHEVKEDELEFDRTWNAEETKNLYYLPQESTSIMNQEEYKYEEKDSSKKYQIPESFQVEKLQNGNIIVGNSKIINYSKLTINLEALKKPSTYKITSQTSFLIYHTHTSESYTVPEVTEIKNYRTTNPLYNVVTVGNALEESLKEKGFFCTHDTTLHDYPSYNGAYGASLRTVENILKNKKYDFLIDIHRDALSSNYHFRPTVEINGEKVAKIMFVVGTNGSGLEHDNWMNNLKLALFIQNRAEEMYPGLFRDLTLSSSRYNQHLSDAAFIIEVGATGNTLDEVRNSMKYLANVIASFQ